MQSIRDFFEDMFTMEDWRSVFLNEDGTILNWNEELATRSQIPRERVLGKGYEVLFAPEGQSGPLFSEALQQAARTGRVKWKVPENIKMAGSRFEHIRLIRVKGEDGGVLGYTLIVPRF